MTVVTKCEACGRYFGQHNASCPTQMPHVRPEPEWKAMFERLTERHNKLVADLERVARERDADRENALQAIQERDGALVKLKQVADAVKGYPKANALATRVQGIVGACPPCAILGRLAVCTHLGRAE